MIIENSVSDAYLAMLDDTTRYLGDNIVQVTRVNMPLGGSAQGHEAEAVHRYLPHGTVNVDPSFAKRLEAFEFNDERTGKWWLEDRIEALFGNTGEYHEALNKEAQYPYVVKSLKAMRERNAKIGPLWNANRMIVTLFDPAQHLHIARAPMPPCLINIAFIPVKDRLSLCATFRAQYTDAKGYGNLYSLAMMLGQVCEATGYTARYLYSIALKPTLRYKKAEAKRFLFALMRR